MFLKFAAKLSGLAPVDKVTLPPHTDRIDRQKQVPGGFNVFGSGEEGQFKRRDNMDADKLAEILSLHKLWVNNDSEGKRANLQGSDLRGADLEGSDLRSANLRGAYLWGAYLRNANLQGAYLLNANLHGAYLQGSDLRNANLRNADLQGAYLRGAYLRNANLRGANLHGAYLQGSDLRGANLEGANLQGAVIENTRLDVTKFKYLSEAIELGKKIFSETWNAEDVAKKYNLYKVTNENKAVIALSQDLSGGFCFVHHRKEIWWWAWSCPNPETATVLWKMED